MIDEKTKIGKWGGGGGGVFLHKMVVLSKHHSTVYKIASQVLHSCIDTYMYLYLARWWTSTKHSKCIKM